MFLLDPAVNRGKSSVGEDNGILLAFQSVPFRVVKRIIAPSIVCRQRKSVPIGTKFQGGEALVGCLFWARFYVEVFNTNIINITRVTH